MTIRTGGNRSRAGNSDFSTMRVLPGRRVESDAWWTDSGILERARALTHEAEQGFRRPFHIFISTDRRAPFGQVIDSFIRTVSPSGLLRGRTPEGRSLVRWTLIISGVEAGVADDSRDDALHRLTEAGVEVQLLHKPMDSNGSAISSARVNVIDEMRRMSLDDDPILLWLDDDLAFDALLPNCSGAKAADPWSWLHEVWQYHEDYPDIDVGLGDVMGAPPLPASSTLKTNLTDLVAHHHGHEVRSSASRWDEADYYYDLSDELRDERPWIMADDVATLGRDGLLFQLFEEGCLNRPLVATEHSLSRARPGRHVRGGNTIIFNRRWVELVDHPLLPRRGDTLWAQIVSRLGGSLSHFPVPLHHLRERPVGAWDERAKGIERAWLRRLEADLIGASIQRWFVRSGPSDEALDIFRDRVCLQARILRDCRALTAQLPVDIATDIAQMVDSGLALTEVLLGESDSLSVYLQEVAAKLQLAAHRQHEMNQGGA